jgi:PIN domain nuclease of toxin-antitoxin system
MRLLVDTHIFLWFTDNSPQLSATARRLISDPDNDIVLSVASVWETAIKVGNGKLALARDAVTFYEE